MPQKTHTTEPAQTRAPRSRNAGALTAANVLAVQRTAGNRAAQRLIAQRRVQAKLTVGPVDDPFEREADRMADAVLSSPLPSALSSPLPSGEGTGVGGDAGLQRETTPDEDELQTKPLAVQITPLAQREALPEEEEVQRQAEEEDELQTKRDSLPTPSPSPQGRGDKVQRNSDGSFNAGADVEQRIARSKGAGSPLPDATRAEMESKFGADFSAVRVHAGSDAAQLNRDLSAHAFTHGSDVYFGAGKFAPAGGEGKHLLAHELTHVVQQSANHRSKSRMITVRVSGTTQRSCSCGKSIKGNKVECDDCKAKRAKLSSYQVNETINRKCENKKWVQEKDGCSVPPAVTAYLAVHQGASLDKDNPAGGKDTVFSNASNLPCDKHDECYQKCSTSGDEWSKCNKEMFNDMWTVCKQSKENLLVKAKCMKFALMYYAGLTAAGRLAYEQRQREVCSCEAESKSLTEKIHIVNYLLDGWVSDEDIQAIEKISAGLSSQNDFKELQKAVGPRIKSLQDIGQRTRLRLALKTTD